MALNINVALTSLVKPTPRYEFYAIASIRGLLFCIVACSGLVDVKKFK